MSTRCNIHFHGWGVLQANVYRHSDGYPDGKSGVPAGLLRFFEELENQTSDTRYGDPEYLASKFVVWQASEYATAGKPLEFLSVGVCIRDHGDIEFVYTVDCDKKDAKGRPTVTWEAC